MRKIILLFNLIIGSLIANFSNAQTALNPGDVMLTGINAGNSDIAFVTWVALQPGTKIYFTNNGWNSAGQTTTAGNARNVEEIATWTNSTASTILAGTVIVTQTASPYTASIGTTTVFSNAGTANPMLKIQDGDQVTVYQPASGNGYSSNNSATATFNGKAISINAWLNAYLTSGTVSDASTYLPSDLASFSVFHSTPYLNPYIHYKGTRSGLSPEGYKPLVMNNSNWLNDWASPLNSTSFSLGVLPVHLVRFAAQWKSTGIELNWETDREAYLLKYEIEYSSNAITFFKVGEVAANQMVEGQYIFRHQPNEGVNYYYRLKMIDKDGSFIYSSIEKVQKTLKNSSLTIKPNPVIDQSMTVASSNLPKNKYSLQIINELGIIVYKQAVDHAGGNISLHVQLPSLAAGSYRLQMVSDEVKLNAAFIVK